MNRHIDTILGMFGAILTFIVSHFNELIGAAVGLVSLGVMLLRLRREWRMRNEKIKREEN